MPSPGMLLCTDSLVIWPLLDGTDRWYVGTGDGPRRRYVIVRLDVEAKPEDFQRAVLDAVAALSAPR